MSLKEIQCQVDKWASQYDPKYWTPHHIVCRLMEETGELAREVNHRWGPKKKKPTEETREVGDEMADILFTLICLANSQNISLDEAWKRMMEKYETRDKDRFKKV